MIEMACLSNATGLISDVRGMHGPKVNTKDLVKVLIRKRWWNIGIWVLLILL